MMPGDITGRIAGADKLLAVFGYWPTFHDAEVVRIVLDRRSPDGQPEPTFQVFVHTWETTRDVDATGVYVTRHHVLVHFRFRDVEQSRLDGFNSQNVLAFLEISGVEDGPTAQAQFEVAFVSTFGVGAEFRCRSVEVLAVTLCDNGGIPCATGVSPV